MSNRLSGSFGLAYVGTIANQPPNWNFEQRDPTPFDVNNVSVGDLWLNQPAKTVWVLVSLQGTSATQSVTVGSYATWVQWAGPSGNTETLTGNSGGAVTPTNDNINVIGDGTTINVVGTPSNSTLTISAIGSGLIDTLTGHSGGAVSPTAGNTNIV